VRGSIVFFALFLVLLLGTQKNRSEAELGEANNRNKKIPAATAPGISTYQLFNCSTPNSRHFHLQTYSITLLTEKITVPSTHLLKAYFYSILV